MFTMRYKFLLFGFILGFLLIGQIGLIFAYISSASDAMKHFAVVETPILNKAHELKLAVVQVQQWLTDIGATHGQDGLDDGFEEAENSARRFGDLLRELLALDGANSQRYRAMEPAFAAYYETGQRMARAYIEQGPAGGNKLMAEFDETAEKFAEQVDSFLADALQRVKSANADQVSALDKLKTIGTEEHISDKILSEALKRLFDEEKDAIEVIKWRDLYERLERATDRTLDVANVLEAIVLEHA